MSWENVELRDVSEYSNDRIETNLLNEKNYISTENMLPNKGGIVDSSYPPSGKNSPKFNANDILVSNIRPYFKKIWFSQNEGGCSNDVIVFKPNKEKIDPKFLYFQLSKDEFFDYMMSGANGTKMPRGNKKAIPKFKFSIPTSLETQKRIASILSTYDDLIENNLKRIKLLEETAQNIYKEWFVNFRFPNYEHTEFDVESGLPVGWEKKSLNNFDCFYQFKEKVKSFIGEKEYLATANVEGINISERGEYFTFDNRPLRAQHLAPQESVWFARMSKTYKVILFTKSSNSDILLSSGFVGFVPKNSQFLPFLFCLINNKLFFETKDLFCSGSTQISLNNESISKLIYVEPNEEIITKFGNKVYPIIEQINKLFELNQKLKEARDILLPRLMNRTIEV